MLVNVRFEGFVIDGSLRPALLVQVVCTGSWRCTYVDAKYTSGGLSVDAQQVSEIRVSESGCRSPG